MNGDEDRGMRNVRVWTLGVVLATLGAGCGGAASLNTGSAALDVVVKDVSMTVVANATVTTTPATKTVTSDELGHALFTGIAARGYTVTAVSAAIGAASADVTVHGGETTKLTLILHKDTLDGGENAEAGSPDAAGDAGRGPDDAGTSSADAPAGDAPASAIVLDVPTKDSNGINLVWSTKETFESFKIYRGTDTAGTFGLVDIVNDPKARAYRDTTGTLGTTYRYRIAGIVQGHAEVVSNDQTITAGIFVAVNTQVERMRADPTRPYLYAIDKVNNSLLFVRLTDNTLEKTIFVGSTPTDIDISLAGKEAFVANSGSTEIAVIDLDMRAKSRSLLVDGTTGTTGSGYVAHLACLAGDVLAYAPAGSYSPYLKLINGTTGATIVATPNIYISTDNRFVASPDGTRLYVTSSYSLYRYDIVGTMLKQVDLNQDYNVSYSSPVTRSGDGMFVFSGPRKILSNNLKSVLGTFAEPILLSNSTGSTVVGAMRVYDGTTFAAKAPLPLSTPTMALSADDKTLFLYNQQSSRIYLYALP